MSALKVLAYSVERRAYSQKLSAKRYPLNAKICLFSIVIFFTLHFNCYAQPISSTELISNTKQYDGKLVVYEGEVIGDVMVRGEYAWLNVNDGQNAIGIWINKALAKETLYTGSYRARGDWLELSGTFHRACGEHGGDLDIHAQAIKKISIGKKIPEKLNLSKRNFALVLLGILILIWILRQLKAK